MRTRIVFLSIAVQLSLQTSEAASPLKCSFIQEGTNINRFTANMDLYGVFDIRGKLCKRPAFDCRFEIKGFTYHPDAIIPEVEFTLIKNKCTRPETGTDLINRMVNISIEKSRNATVCQTSVLVNFPLATDSKPIFDGKEIRRLNEKFLRKIWP